MLLKQPGFSLIAALTLATVMAAHAKDDWGKRKDCAAQFDEFGPRWKSAGADPTLRCTLIEAILAGQRTGKSEAGMAPGGLYGRMCANTVKSLSGV